MGSFHISLISTRAQHLLYKNWAALRRKNVYLRYFLPGTLALSFFVKIFVVEKFASNTQNWNFSFFSISCLKDKKAKIINSLFTSVFHAVYILYRFSHFSQLALKKWKLTAETRCSNPYTKRAILGSFESWPIISPRKIITPVISRGEISSWEIFATRKFRRANSCRSDVLSVSLKFKIHRNILIHDSYFVYILKDFQLN